MENKMKMGGHPHGMGGHPQGKGGHPGMNVDYNKNPFKLYGIRAILRVYSGEDEKEI